MVQREEYLQKLILWRDEQVIKVVTGIRRCGKSTLLAQFQAYLKDDGVEDRQIVSLNFEELENEELLDYRTLYQALTARLCPDKTTYIFLDEVQKVPEFEKVVDSLYVKDRVDLYITGSNSYMLSGELATLLSGRYVELSILPLSFREYCQLQPSGEKDALFAAFLQDGGFPYIASMNRSKEKVDMYLEGIYNTIIIKDIEERQRRRDTDPNRRKVTDIALLKAIAKFLAGSVGNPISVKGIADYITSTGRKVSQNTVADYIEVLSEAFVFYPAERFDVIGKQLMKMNQKLYIVDLGIRRYLLSRRDYDLGFSLENVVYLELLRRGYGVNVGRVGNTEVDFVAKKDDRYHYFQVTATMLDPATFEREITPLRNIRDNYPKTILTLDRMTLGNYDGIEAVNAVDWLLNP
ncbi:MAG: ATP-binding protein [Dysosmobacter welbionis]|uniref:ATP-binding protein n=1 Tax=Dysosmobacter welbionis TaxID=2093857 RepID=UPI00399B44E8